MPVGSINPTDHNQLGTHMNFNRMTVGKRLYLGFGALLAVLVVVTLVAITKVQAINSALKVNSEEHAAIQRYAINFRGFPSIPGDDLVTRYPNETDANSGAPLRPLADG